MRFIGVSVRIQKHTAAVQHTVLHGFTVGRRITAEIAHISHARRIHALPRQNDARPVAADKRPHSGRIAVRILHAVPVCGIGIQIARTDAVAFGR